MNSYNKTKQFTEWLKGVRPDFAIESGYYLDKDDCYFHVIEVLNRVSIQVSKPNDFIDYIDTDTLHAILWELFDVENPEHANIMSSEATLYAIVKEMARLYVPKTIAQKLWHKYTAGKKSMWLTNPDAVLDDIMHNYNQL